MNDFDLLHIYVDGSCIENRNVTNHTKAGWGFCVIKGDTGQGRGRGEIVHESNGEVITNHQKPDFIGAEVGSNNTGELSAIAHSLRWVLSNVEKMEIVICSDSTYAGNIASGKWKAKANIRLAKLTQSLWKEVTFSNKLSWKHVRAHRGHRWNERADHLAFRAMKNESVLPLQFWKPGLR